MSNEEDIGYMKATIRANMVANKELKAEFRQHALKQEQRDKEIMESIQGLSDELNMYKNAIRIFKLLAATAVLILTLKFGDITSLWGGK